MEKKVYSIGQLAALRYLHETETERDIRTDGFECPEGRASIVCVGPDDATLVFVSTKRKRGESKEATVSQNKLRRIAMCYLVDNPGVCKLSCDVLSVTIGNCATVSVSATKGAFTWEHEG